MLGHVAAAELTPKHGRRALAGLLGAGSRGAVAGRLLLVAVILLVLAWVLFLAQPPSQTGTGGWRTTTFGSAVDDPTHFVKTLLDSLTYAGLLFVVASGFTLIFGLMRVVNMAHGAFFLLAGYIAVRLAEGLHARRHLRADELAGELPQGLAAAARARDRRSSPASG